MDLKNLSSNWKKLQGTLKKDNVSATKRKSSDRETQDGVVKKRKTETVEGKRKLERPQIALKRKRMSQNGTDGGDDGAQETTKKSTSRRSSIAVVAESKPKVNEGRSTTLVHLLLSSLSGLLIPVWFLTPS